MVIRKGVPQDVYPRLAAFIFRKPSPFEGFRAGHRVRGETEDQDYAPSPDRSVELDEDSDQMEHDTSLGIHNNDMAGFYRSSYKDITGATKTMINTQFESLDARRCFPLPELVETSKL